MKQTKKQATPERNVTLSIGVPLSWLDALDELCLKAGIRNRSQLVRQMIQKALETK